MQVKSIPRSLLSKKQIKQFKQQYIIFLEVKHKQIKSTN